MGTSSRTMSHASLIFTLTSVMGCGSALAQALDDPATIGLPRRNESVLERARPDYDAAGIRSGSFIFLPKLTTTLEASDNIYAGSTTKTSDTAAVAQPEATIRSDWSRNMVEGYARATLQRYAANGSENTSQYELRLSGRYDFGEASNVNAGAQFAHLTEPRYLTTTTRNVSRPVQFDLTNLRFGSTQVYNRVRLVESLELRDYSYSDARTTSGDFVLERDRDRVEYLGSGRAEFAVSSETSVFVLGELNQRRYQLKPPKSLYDRDSDGYVVSAGVRLDLSHLARGEFRAGYLSQSYSSAVFRTVDGLSVNGKVSIFLSPLSTMIVTAERSVGDAADPRASSFLTTTEGLELDHELRRNVILQATVSHARDDYRGIDRLDDRWNARLGGSYLLNRNIGIGVYYNFTDVSSSGFDKINTYRVNEVVVALVLQR
jgi:hypothetical protein